MIAQICVQISVVSGVVPPLYRVWLSIPLELGDHSKCQSNTDFSQVTLRPSGNNLAQS